MVATSASSATFTALAVRCGSTAALKPGSKAIRNVFISDYRREFEAALAYMHTDDFKIDMRLRPLVERIIAALVRYNGARRARRRGQDKADFQAKMNATAFNIKTWIKLLYPKPKRPRPEPGVSYA
jgi:uncharacterized protein with von Willebrand factor type A (vWA) domain